MARYRKIDVRIWIDQKFRSLSEQAKLLWFYLLTNPSTTSIPGLYRARESGMAEDLGWTVELFRERFGECFGKGMVRVDWKAGLVWIPNVVRHNPPENPNIVKSWASTADELPECPLKLEAIHSLRLFVEPLGEGFREAFGKVFGDGSLNGMANQEQEQEQEQEEEKRIAADAPPLEASSTPAKKVKSKKPAKAKPEEACISEKDALEAIASTSKGRFLVCPVGTGRFELAKMRKENPEPVIWFRIGEWLAAGGDEFKGVLDGRAIGKNVTAWVVQSKAWDGKPFGKRSGNGVTSHNQGPTLAMDEGSARDIEEGFRGQGG